jgi:hypothetical protein
VCPRCGSEDETDLHTYWTCPANHNIDEGCVQQTQYLSARAVARASELPCLWLRGILPAHLTEVPPQYEPTNDVTAVYVNPYGVHPNNLWGSGTYYGDASGGEHTEFPKLRRVGCGVAVVDDAGFFLYGIRSNLPGPIQTVSRGELFALVLLISHVSDNSDVEFITDNEGVYLKVQAGPNACTTSSNCKLYADLFTMIREKSVKLNIRWMPSHLKDLGDALVLPIGVSMVDVHGNDQADLLAGMSADDFKLANAVTKGHIHYVKLVSKIQRRLATILIHLPSRKHDRVVPSTVKRPEIRTLIESSSHTVILDGSRIYCSSCCSSFWVHDAALRHLAVNAMPR